MPRPEKPRTENNFPAIVYAHTYAPWDSTASRQQYLMRALSQHTRVFYLDCARFSPRITSVPRPSAEVIHPNLIVVRNAYSLRYSRWVRLGGIVEKAVCAIDGRRLNAIFRHHGAEKTTLFISSPDENLVRGLTPQDLIYDCMDPYFDASAQSAYNQIEFSISKRADLVLCSAQSLLERLQPYNHNIHLVPNACSYEEYAPENNQDVPRPSLLEGRNEPVIGFSGYIDGRVDLDLLRETARRLPQFTFVFAGGVRGDRDEQFAQLQKLPNVITLNTVQCEENRAWVKSFSVGLIPFVPNKANDCLNTVKMWMYFAAGKPVVSTDLRESRLHEPYVSVAKNEDEFVEAIIRAVEDDSTSQIEARLAFARRNTWRHRADRVLELLHQHL